MSNPARAPTTPYEFNADTPPDPYWSFLNTDEWATTVKNASKLPVITAVLESLDVELRPSFAIPREMCVSAEALQGNKPFLARAKKGKLAVRVSSRPAYDMVVAVWGGLPEADRRSVAASITDSVYCDAGAEFTIGRFSSHAPTKGIRGLVPPTAEEARLSLLHNGLDLPAMPPSYYTAYPLEAKEDETHIQSNPKASTGYPVLGRSDDPIAAAKVSQLAVTVRHELVSAAFSGGGIRAWLRKAEDERPYLVSLMGKCKADHYSAKKVQSKQMRFYNTVPKQMLLNMQVATQPLEYCKRHVLNNDEARSVSGASLAHGGAEKLLLLAEAALQDRRCAYFTCGDDTFFAYRDKALCIHLFALDCTAFDLTQHGDISGPIHERIRDQLALIDVPAADLWFAYMRKRQVVVALTCVVRTRHWGTSGMPLQSLVNGCYMDVGCQRMEKALNRLDQAKELDEPSINRAIEVVGRTLNMKVRIEQYRRGEPGQSLLSMLSERPFLFVGYNFYVSPAGTPRIYCDLPRQLAQMRFPTQKWMKKGKAMDLAEGVRLGSILINWGVFPWHLMKAQLLAQDYVQDHLEALIKEFGDTESGEYRWVVSESPFGLATLPSLSGLLTVVQRDPDEFWDAAPTAAEAEELSRVKHELVYEKKAAWGEYTAAVDAAEQEERRALGIPDPPAPKRLPLPISTPSKPISTHPVTSANFGRPPPIAVWGPDKPKKRRDWGTGALRVGRIAHVLAQDDEEHWYEYVVAHGYHSDENASYTDEQTNTEVDQDFYENWRNNQAYYGNDEGVPDVDDGTDLYA